MHKGEGEHRGMGSAAKMPPLVKYFMTVPELVNTAA